MHGTARQYMKAPNFKVYIRRNTIEFTWKVFFDGKDHLKFNNSLKYAANKITSSDRIFKKCFRRLFCGKTYSRIFSSSGNCYLFAQNCIFPLNSYQCNSCQFQYRIISVHFATGQLKWFDSSHKITCTKRNFSTLVSECTKLKSLNLCFVKSISDDDVTGNN